MTKLNYEGLTTYIKVNEDNWERLGVLAHAVKAIAAKMTENPVIISDTYNHAYRDVFESVPFRVLRANDVARPVTAFSKEFLPVNTPAAYSEVQIESVNVKGLNLVRLYIPAMTDNQSELGEVMDALFEVIVELFGEDVLNMTRRTSHTDEDFEAGVDQVLISANRKVPVAA